MGIATGRLAARFIRRLNQFDESAENHLVRSLITELKKLATEFAVKSDDDFYLHMRTLRMPARRTFRVQTWKRATEWTRPPGSPVAYKSGERWE